MTKYTRKVAANGVTQYRDVTKNQIVSKENISPAVLEELNLAAEGEVIDSEGITNDHSTETDSEGRPVNTDKPQAPTTENNEEIQEQTNEEEAQSESHVESQEEEEKADENETSQEEETRDDPLDDEKEEELSDADKELAARPELQGKFKAEQPKTVKRPKMDDGKEAAKSPAQALLPGATEKGFGFPRRNGKTGDVFDFDVPHDVVKFVDGFMVPLSLENYNTKNDIEIHNRLVEIGYVSEDGVRLV